MLTRSRHRFPGFEGLMKDSARPISFLCSKINPVRIGGIATFKTGAPLLASTGRAACLRRTNMELEQANSGCNLKTSWITRLAVWAILLPAGFGFQGPTPESLPNISLSRPKPESSRPAAPVLRIDSSLVLIPVRVTTEIGSPVLNLTRKDFRLFEDGVEQTIAEFSKEEQPASVVIVFDASGSMKNKIARSFQAVAALLQSGGQQDEFCLVKLNGRPRVAVPFTTDSDLVLEELSRNKPSGSTSLLDAIYLALAEVRHARNPRRGIVIVSDGGDNFSRHSMQAIKRLLVESDSQLFAMGIYDANYAVRHFVEERNGPRLLDDLARSSGGREYAVDSAGDLPVIGERIGSALRREYVLGYYPSNKAQDGKYRCVTLNVNAKTAMQRILLHYRQGYYAVSE
jgi:Ca-activated chloride channel family protein